MYPFQISGKNVKLTHLLPTTENATLLCALVGENKRYLMSVFEHMVDAYKTPEKTLASLHYDETMRQLYQMLPYYIFVQDKLVGEITAEWTDKNAKTEVLYWLSEKYAGQGYMGEALTLMENVLFQAGHKQIQLYIDAANWRSLNVAEKAGYQLANDDSFFKTVQMWYEKRSKICSRPLKKSFLSSLFCVRSKE